MGTIKYQTRIQRISYRILYDFTKSTANETHNTQVGSTIYIFDAGNNFSMFMWVLVLR